MSCLFKSMNIIYGFYLKRLVQSFATVLDCSSKMHLTLSKTELDLIFELYENILKHEYFLFKFLSGLAVYNNLIMFNELANAFCAWGLNPEEFGYANFWNYWFSAAQKTVEALYINESKWFIYKTITDNKEPIYCTHQANRVL